MLLLWSVFVFHDTEENMILIKEKKTWEEASDYCIKNHRGLVSITDSSQQRWAAMKAKEADTDHVWLGLRYTCVLDLWFWVNDELVCYKNWASDKEPGEDCDRAVAMSKGEGHKWHTKADTEEFNFICALHWVTAYTTLTVYSLCRLLSIKGARCDSLFMYVRGL